MFKDRLKQLRIDKGVTQADIAKAIGVSAATIGNYEQGTREPRNNEMWQKLADYFCVSVDELMDKESSDTKYILKTKGTSSSTKKDWTQQFREDIPIIYEGIDITSLVFAKYDTITPVTREQRFTYAKFASRSGHVLYARRNLLDILADIKSQTISEISNDLTDLIDRVENSVVYWYKKCWNNIDDLFPEATTLETLYDLLNKCLCVDMIAEQEFTLIPIEDDFDWLREKLH